MMVVLIQNLIIKIKKTVQNIFSKNCETLAKEGTEEHTKCKEGRKKSYSSFKHSTK